jgi:tetratricopeptide (TPR) repeat protein
VTKGNAALDDTLKAIERKLDALKEGTGPDLRAKIDLLNDLARALERRDLDRSCQVSLEAEQLLEQVTYPEGKATCFRNLASALLSKGDLGQALEYGLAGLEICERIGFQEILPSAVGVLGQVYRRLGEYDIALEYYQRQYKAAQALDDKTRQSTALNNMSTVLGSLGDLDAAIKMLQEALTLFQALEDDNGQVLALNNLAMVYKLQGDYSQATVFGQKALDLSRVRDFQLHLPAVLDTLGSIHVAQGAYDRAAACFHEATSVAEALGRKNVQAVCMLNLGQMYVEQKQIDLGKEQLLQALPLLEEKGPLYQCHQLLSQVYEAQGDLGKALDHYTRFHEIKEAVFNAESDQRVRNLQTLHQTEAAQREAEIYRLRNVELEEALAQVKQLSGLLPICANCKKVRDDEGYWHDVAVYLQEHSEADLSHGICPECMQELYPEFYGKDQIDE